MPFETITSRQNARVKDAVKLRSARQRAKQGRFLIDGQREITRALDAGIEPLEAFLLPQQAESQLVERLSESSALVAEVSTEVWEKLRFGERDDGVLVVARTPERRLTELELPPNLLVAVLAGLEKPGNVGAILRTADGAGVDAVIVADPRTDLFNPNTIRASMGTVFAPHVCTATGAETLEQLRQWQLPIVATRPDAIPPYSDVDYRQGAAIVLGSESDGLTDLWQAGDIQAVQIPMHGVADSLNVSATAAVLFYEAVRQREG